MKVARIAFLFFLFLSLISCAGGKGGQPEDTGAAGPDTGSKGTYKIGVDDGLQITVWRNPDLSTTVPVRPDGKISVPLVGDVQAGGLTPEEVAAHIKQKLAYYIRDPNVTVIVANLRSHEFLSRVRDLDRPERPFGCRIVCTARNVSEGSTSVTMRAHFLFGG